MVGFGNGEAPGRGRHDRHEQHQAAAARPSGCLPQRDEGGRLRAILFLFPFNHAVCDPLRKSSRTRLPGWQPIVHLEVDLQRVVQWANANGWRWAFSLSNAGAVYAQFRAKLDQLSEINWGAIAATDFRSADVKEAKQAEFLVRQSFPWQLVDRIGVHSQGVVQRVSTAMQGAAHRPRIEIRREWYY